MVSYNENCFYEILFDRNIETNIVNVICYNPFSRKKRTSYLIDDEITYLSTLPNNYFTFQDEITIEVDIDFDNISIDFGNEIVRKLANFINQLSNFFKNAKILDLSLSLSLTTTDYDYLSRLLGQIRNDSIETIKFSVQDLFQIIPEGSLLENFSIFDTLPKFKEISVNGYYNTPHNYRFNVMDSILSYFIRCLGNRNNCILNFNELNYSSTSREIISQYMKHASDYNFYIKYKDEFDLPSTTYLPLLDREPFRGSNIFNNITSIIIKITSHQLFYPIIKSVGELIKLKEIHVSMLNININNISNISWKNLKTLQLFNLYFCLNEKIHQIPEKNDNYHDQLEIIKYFTFILPLSVTKLRLHNICFMTNDVSKFLNKSLPNLQFLWIQCGMFKNKKCLEHFTNLKYLILLNVHVVMIPKSVEIFIMEEEEGMTNLMGAEQIFKQYSKSFPHLIIQKPSLCRIYFKKLIKLKEFFDVIYYYHTNNPPSRFLKISRF